jgi:hypothetical protein
MSRGTENEAETIIVEKNRQRAFWGLAIVAFMILVSLILILTGLFGSGEVLWVPVWLGVVGLLGFGVSAAMILRTLRSPWHLALHPGGLRLHTPMYVLDVPWGQVTSIGVDEVSFREGVVLVFADPAEVVERANFYMRASRPDLISDRETMLARMEENFEALGYHLGIPGRILEMGPEQLAELLTRARRGVLWEAGR